MGLCHPVTWKQSSKNTLKYTNCTPLSHIFGSPWFFWVSFTYTQVSFFSFFNTPGSASSVGPILQEHNLTHHCSSLLQVCRSLFFLFFLDTHLAAPVTSGQSSAEILSSTQKSKSARTLRVRRACQKRYTKENCQKRPTNVKTDLLTSSSCASMHEVLLRGRRTCQKRYTKETYTCQNRPTNEVSSDKLVLCVNT